MAYAYRSVSAGAGNSSGSTLTISRPSGTTDGDLLIAIFYLESDTNTWSSVPSGWETGPTIANTGAFKLHLFWKIAASEPASWNWTPASSAWRAGFCAAYSGAVGTGLSRVEISGGSQGDSVSPATSQTAPSVTTSTDADLVVFVYGNFGGTDAVAVTGFASNIRQSYGGLLLTDAIKSPAGATGTTAPSSGPGTQDYAAMHVAFLIDTGGGGPASVSLTGLASGEAFGTPIVGDVTPVYVQPWRSPLATPADVTGTSSLFYDGSEAGEIARAAIFDTSDGAASIALTGLASSGSLGAPELGVTLSLTGLASSEAFGVPTIGSAAASVTLTGLASSETVGTPSLVAVTSLTALAGAGALGTPSLAAVVSPAALAGAEALGAPTLSPSASLVGIASGEGVGTPALAATLALTGLSSSEAFGVPTVGGVPASVTLAGLATSEALGSPSIGATLSLLAIVSAEALGLPALAASVGLTGIASSEAFGSPTIGGAPASVQLIGLATSEAVSAPSLLAVIVPTGVASALAFGTPSVVAAIGLTRLASSEAFGTPTIGGAPASISLTGLASSGALGSIVAGVVVSVIGLASSEAVGVPSLSSQVGLDGLISAEAFGWPTLTGPITRFVPLTLEGRDDDIALADRDRALALEARGVLLTVSKTHEPDLELSDRPNPAALTVRNR